MTQRDKVLKWLKRRPINPMQALHYLGTYRLAARIYELREMGYTIDTERVPLGDKITTRYRLSERI